MKISVVGAGSWGLATAEMLSNKGHEVSVFVKETKDYNTLTSQRELADKLPGIILNESIQYTLDLQTAVKDAEIIVVAVPSKFLRLASRDLGNVTLAKDVIILSLVKGMEFETSMRMSEVIADEVKSLGAGQIAVLSGPSHAEEVVRGILTTVVIASDSLASAEKCQDVFMSPSFRVYASDDVVGVETGGALKNIIAVAAGILDGLELGDNTMGALVTRGITEIARFGERFGGELRTFMGLSGIGDLVTTCCSKHSRNRYVGEEIARGRSLDEVIAGMSMVAEGVETVKSVWKLAQKEGIDMPITQAVYEILYEGKNAKDAARDLMEREPKAEQK